MRSSNKTSTSGSVFGFRQNGRLLAGSIDLCAPTYARLLYAWPALTLTIGRLATLLWRVKPAVVGMFGHVGHRSRWTSGSERSRRSVRPTPQACVGIA